MATAFEHISQNFRLTAHGIFKDYVQSWLEKFHPQFETLTKIWAVFQQDYKSLVSNATSPEEIWALMESHINQQIDWITNFENLLKLQDRTQFWILSEQQFKRFMSEYESKVEITVLSSDFDPKPEDRFWESLWKRFQLFKIGILNYSDRFANKLRVLVKKDLREPHRRRFRQISVAQVIKRYLEIPVNQLLVEEWRKIQRTVGRTLHDLHLLSAELKKIDPFAPGTIFIFL